MIGSDKLTLAGIIKVEPQAIGNDKPLDEHYGDDSQKMTSVYKVSRDIYLGADEESVHDMI